MGKGSTPRPFSVSNEEYAKRWDEIFAKKDKLEPEGANQHPKCSQPFCSCEVKCRELKDDASNAA